MIVFDNRSVTDFLSRSILFVAHRTTFRIREFCDLCTRYGVNLSRKQTSEILAGILETSFHDFGTVYGFDVAAPKSDHEPDLYISNVPVELKVKYGRQGEWRGGAYTKRPGHHVFFAWDHDKDMNNDIVFFAIHKHLIEADWRGGNEGNYYATYISLDDLLPNGTILLGEAKLARTRYHAIPEFV